MDVLIYAHNTQVHDSTGRSPFDLVLSRLPQSTFFEAVASEPTSVQWITNLGNMFDSTRSNATRRQRLYKRDFGARVRQALLKLPGDYLYIKQDPSLKWKHKLSSRADGILE